MHYSDITNQIAKEELREDLGATPANTVAAVIALSLQKEGAKSPFIRVSRGIYGLRSFAASPPAAVLNEIEETTSPETGVINAFGMYWDRTKVSWTGGNPRILGQQQTNAAQVDFHAQKGVYLLHDAQGVVYVGRVTDRALGKRLQEHTIDRLSGRWTRFSWFGVYRVNPDGSLAAAKLSTALDMDTVIATMEAVLIEGLEPRQNRRRGDDIQAFEYLQVEDPDLVKNRKVALARELLESVQKVQ